MNSSTGLFTFLGLQIDQAMQTVVTSTSAALCAALALPFAIALALWVLLHGWSVLRGESSDPLGEFVRQVLRVSLIASLALSAGTYQSWICDNVNAFGNELSAILSGTGDGIYAALDDLAKQGSELAVSFMKRGDELLPTGGYADILTGLVMVVANSLLLCILGGYAVLAKVALTIALALGPLFITTMLFPQTAHLFRNWLEQLLNYSFLGGLVGMLAGITLKIGNFYFAAANGQNPNILNGMRQLSEVVLLDGALAIVALQVPRLASAFAGGMALASVRAHAHSNVQSQSSMEYGKEGSNTGYTGNLAAAPQAMPGAAAAHAFKQALERIVYKPWRPES